MPSRTGSVMSQSPAQIDTTFVTELYPFVDESKTPLPRAWNGKDKHAYLGLASEGRAVHYKGSGKTHKDAASVRATHPIPATCGVYYFEIKVVSKGRDGYMGVGFSSKNVSLGRLPGWDKASFGYHGDDGCVFCSSGSGSPFGPTFSTGDIVGCGLQLADRNCFFTKNGHRIGPAFANLPNDLYPIVGLQTPGEVIEANFGQSPFVFDIEGEIREAQVRLAMQASKIPLTPRHHELMSRLVLTYLAHQGYHQTAEAYSRLTGIPLTEEGASIRNRQKIKSAILAGKVGEGIELIRSLYPGLLDQNTDLLFMLKCRQFIEMVNRTGTEQPPAFMSGPVRQRPLQHQPYAKLSASPFRSPSESPRHSTPVRKLSPRVVRSVSNSPVPHLLSVGSATNGCDFTSASGQPSFRNEHECPMDTEEEPTAAATNGVATNGNAPSGSDDDCGSQDGISGEHGDGPTKSNIGELVPNRGWSSADVSYYEGLLQFGRELLQFSQELQAKHGPNAKNRAMLEKAYALLAYSDPWLSPVAYQLNPSQRESVASAVNSAILLSLGSPPNAPLECLNKHGEHLMQTMAGHGLGACALVHPKLHLAPAAGD